MKKFLVIFLSSPESIAKWRALDEDARKERATLAAWDKWLAENRAALVEEGTPLLGKTKRIDRNGISDTKNDMTSHAFVLAESHEAAAKLFVNHPHFMLFPGESVEVMECLPLPKM
jgi:hypothetical protein